MGDIRTIKIDHIYDNRGDRTPNFKIVSGEKQYKAFSQELAICSQLKQGDIITAEVVPQSRQDHKYPMLYNITLLESAKDLPLSSNLIELYDNSDVETQQNFILELKKRGVI